MVKCAVQVCVRARPTSNFASGLLNIDQGDRSVKVHIPKPAGQHINNQQEDWKFRFHNVLDNASQEVVYDSCAADIVDSVLEGYNGTILAYGQTGAGKTFTMCGGSQSYKYRGIIPRSISHVFRYIESNPQYEFIVRASYLEVYNECFYDLLQNDGGNIGDLAVREDGAGVVSVKGLTQAIVGSEEDALNVLFNGETNRAIAEHQMNKSSTRSHCIFTIHLERRSRVESSEKVVHSKLNLVDLAGSERVGKTNSKGSILEEAKYINKSLTFLEQVVIALSNKNRDHVPFRQSKLTNVLRDSLGGNCKTRLIANIWSEKEQLEETISTLKFATRMMRVSNEATINVKMDPQQLLYKYEREIKQLKQELQMHDSLSNRGSVSYDDYTPEQHMELQQTITQYVRGEVDEIEIESLKQVRELFSQFRIYIQAMEARPGSKASTENTLQQEEKAGSVPPTSSSAQQQGETESTLVGGIDENDAGGFVLGVAPRDAAPPSNDYSPSEDALRSPTAASGRVEADAPNDGTSGGRSTSQAGETQASNIPPLSIPNETLAFEEYKQREGAELNETFLSNKRNLKEKKTALKVISEKVNAAKRTIDSLNEKIQMKRADRSRGETGENEDVVEIIDEEEYSLIRQVKEQKKVYQTQFHERKMIQSEVSYLKGLVEQAKRTLADSFLTHYNARYGQFISNDDDSANTGSGGDTQRTSGSGSTNDSASVLDDGEAFERLERQKVISEDPDSIAFFNARKAATSSKKASRTRVVKGRGTRRGFA